VVPAGWRIGEFILQKVLLLLPGLCVKMSEIGANQMKKILIKISTISTSKQKKSVIFQEVAKMHVYSS